MDKFFKYFFVIIFISSCSGNKENNLEIYKNFKSNFNDEPFIILKNNLKNEDLNHNKYFEVSFPRYVYVFNHSYIYIVKKYDEKEFELKVNRLKSKSKINKKITDSHNYFSINKNDSIEEIFFPLPDISNEYSNLEDFVDKNQDYILGINYKKGIFFNEHFYNENRKNE